MPSSDDDAADNKNVPEPASEDFKMLQDQMSALMAMMQQQTVETASRMDDMEARNLLLADEVAFKNAPTPTASPSKSRSGKTTSFKLIPTATLSAATSSRRSSVF